jgi:hypothetical protein
MIRRGLVAWSVLLAVGCPSDPTPRDECAVDPDFFVTVGSEAGGLPDDLWLQVEYGGGKETFSFAPTEPPQVVFCTRVSGEGGAAAPSALTAGGTGAGGAAGATESLECELWTEGPATIEVKALGYEPVERELKVDLEVCTTAVTLELVHEEPPQ